MKNPLKVPFKIGDLFEEDDPTEDIPDEDVGVAVTEEQQFGQKVAGGETLAKPLISTLDLVKCPCSLCPFIEVLHILKRKIVCHKNTQTVIMSLFCR